MASSWRGYDKKFPELRVVYAVLCAPAWLAILKCNFGEAGKLVNRQSGSISPAYVEMILEGIVRLDSFDVDANPAEYVHVDSAIPLRLRDAKKRAEICDMDRFGAKYEASLDECRGAGLRTAANRRCSLLMASV